jgi:hypothetical protein
MRSRPRALRARSTSGLVAPEDQGSKVVICDSTGDHVARRIKLAATEAVQFLESDTY